VAAAVLADVLRGAVGSIHSGARAPRARGRSARSARRCPPRELAGLLIGSKIHGSRPPSAPSAPPRSSTVKAMSKRPAHLSRSYPLRDAFRPRSGPVIAAAGCCSTLSPPASSHTSGWRPGAPRAAACPRSPRSTRPPTRTFRRKRGPSSSLDTVRIDHPPRATTSGWTRTADLTMLPRGGRASNATATKARVVRPGPSPSPAPRSTPSAQREAARVVLPRLSTGPHNLPVSPRPPSDHLATAQSAGADRCAYTTTEFDQETRPEHLLVGGRRHRRHRHR